MSWVGFVTADARFAAVLPAAGGRWLLPSREQQDTLQADGTDDVRPTFVLADTPDGAWAELLRHEEIDRADDAAQLRRRVFAVELPDAAAHAVPIAIDDAVARGDRRSWDACRTRLAELLLAGAEVVAAPSAALAPGAAGGNSLAGTPQGDRDGVVFVLLGSAVQLRCWPVGEPAPPSPELLTRVAPLPPPPPVVEPAGRPARSDGGDRRSGADRRRVLDLGYFERGGVERRRRHRRSGVDRRHERPD